MNPFYISSSVVEVDPQVPSTNEISQFNEWSYIAGNTRSPLRSGWEWIETTNIQNRCPYDHNSNSYVDGRYIDAQGESSEKMDFTLYDIQEDNDVMRVKENFIYYQDDVQAKLKDRKVSFYTREALPYIQDCQLEKITVIQKLEDNREMLVGSRENPGGATKWVLTARRWALALILLNIPLGLMLN